MMNHSFRLSSRMFVMILALLAVVLLPLAAMAEETNIITLKAGEPVEFTANSETATVLQFEIEDDAYFKLSYKFENVKEYEIEYSNSYDDGETWDEPYRFDGAETESAATYENQHWFNYEEMYRMYVKATTGAKVVFKLEKCDGVHLEGLEISSNYPQLNETMTITPVLEEGSISAETVTKMQWRIYSQYGSDYEYTSEEIKAALENNTDCLVTVKDIEFV